jgi:hypothetical protein
MSKIHKIFFIFLSIIITYFITRVVLQRPSLITIAIILAVGILAISFFSPYTGLTFLVFSMLLSPELKLAGVPGRDVVVRIDDLLIFAVFFGWFARSVFTKKIEVVLTEVLTPMFFYTLVCIISTYFGITSGIVAFKKAFFYILKYTEYFIIYFLTTQIVQTKQQLKNLVIAFLITSVVVNIYGISLIGKVPRIYAPFDAPGAEAALTGGEVGAGEANTYGGYLIIVISLLVSLFCYSELPTINFLYLFLIIFSLIPLAYTKSRSSYFGFVPMVLTIIFLTEKKRTLILSGLLLLFALSPIVFPSATATVVDRIKETFAGPSWSEEEAVILGFKVKELSALARVNSWKKAISEFIPKRPILGFGVTGVGLVDSQIPLIIGETGLLGVVAFLWLVFSVFKSSIYTFKTAQDTLLKSISLCVISSLVGLLFHSVGANTFIIIRIMEPFWFLCGLVSISQIIKFE